MKNIATIFGLFLSLATLGQSTEQHEEIAPNVFKVEHFHTNGKIMQQGQMINGKYEGLWKSFDENGLLTAEGNFKNGKKEGLWNFYSAGKIDFVIYKNNTLTEIKSDLHDNLVSK